MRSQADISFSVMSIEEYQIGNVFSSQVLLVSVGLLSSLKIKTKMLSAGPLSEVSKLTSLFYSIIMIITPFLYNVIGDL